MINYLIEIDIVKVNGTSREYQTLRFSTLPVSPLKQTYFYDRRISESGLPTKTKEIQNIFYGKTSRSFGSIVIINSDGAYNYLLSEGWTLENRPCRVLQGDTSDTYASYVIFLSGKTGVSRITSESITLEYNDGSLDLSTVPHIDKENVTSTISDAVNSIISAASVSVDGSVATWLTTHGTKQILLNFANSSLGSVLDSIVTPLSSYYGFTDSGTLFIREFDIPTSGTPVVTLGQRDVLPGYSRQDINRLYWRTTAQYWTLVDTTYEATEVKKFDGIHFSGAATSLDSGNKTGIPCGTHTFQVGDNVRVYEDDVYQGEYAVQSETTPTVVAIDKSYIANTFTDAIIRNTTQYPFAQDGYNVGGIFTSSTDASDAAQSYLDLYSVPRHKFSVTTKRQVLEAKSVNNLTLGDYVCLNLDQPYGPVCGTLTKVVNNIADNEIGIEVTV